MTFSKNCSITLLECFHQHLQGYQKSSYIKEKAITSGGFYHFLVVFAKPGSHTSENRSENHITRRGVAGLLLPGTLAAMIKLLLLVVVIQKREGFISSSLF